MSDIERFERKTLGEPIDPLESFALKILDTARCEFIVSDTQNGLSDGNRKCGLEPNEVVFWRDVFDSGRYPDSRASCGPAHSSGIRAGVSQDLINAGYDYPDFNVYIRRPQITEGE